MDYREVTCNSVDWIALAQEKDQWRAYVSAIMNLRVPQKPINYGKMKISQFSSEGFMFLLSYFVTHNMALEKNMASRNPPFINQVNSNCSIYGALLQEMVLGHRCGRGVASLPPT